MELNQLLSANDSFICDYNGVNTALSTNNERYYQFMANTGNTVTYSTLINDFDNGPFIDSILGLEYLYKTVDSYEAYYKFDNDILIINDDGTVSTAYSKVNNPYALKIGYLVYENENIEFEFLIKNIYLCTI